MNKLVVFFYYTGNTKMIANKIREKLNCDILEIKTVIPYSEDYDTVVNDEQNSEESYSDKLVTKEQDIENWIKTL